MDSTMRKRMIVCTPFGKFVNGDQHGVMDKKRLRALVDNFKKHARQVPVYALGDHVESLDDRVADGWVEDIFVDAEGRLVADVKLIGGAVGLVLEDRIRLASIATVQGKNPDGTAQGEVLQHVLLTNDAFDKAANIQIAAALAKGVELFASFTSALSQEAEMADTKKLDEEITRLKDENAALKAATADETLTAQLKEAQTLLAEKTREVSELTAITENLKGDLVKFQGPRDEVTVQLQAAHRQLRAEKIRRLVKSGVDAGQFSRAIVGDPNTGYGHPSDEMVLTWFKASTFRDDMHRLDIMLETMPKQRLGRTFGAGAGSDEKPEAMSEEDKQAVIALGHDPEKVMAALKSKDATDYAAKTAHKE